MDRQSRLMIASILSEHRHTEGVTERSNEEIQNVLYLERINHLLYCW